MPKILLPAIFWMVVLTVKGQDFDPIAAPVPTETPASESLTAAPSDLLEIETTPSTPPMFQNIMSTLAERLNITMEKPFFQSERDRIMASTRKGLNRCMDNFKATNKRIRYRLCVDSQVQSALKMARMVEFRRFGPDATFEAEELQVSEKPQPNYELV